MELELRESPSSPWRRAIVVDICDGLHQPKRRVRFHQDAGGAGGMAVHLGLLQFRVVRDAHARALVHPLPPPHGDRPPDMGGGADDEDEEEEV